MKIVIAPDSFKGSLSSKEICNIIKSAVDNIFPDSSCLLIPLADGGEGTLDVILPSLNGTYISFEGTNPVGETMKTQYGIYGNGKNAFIEMTAISGLTTVSDEKRNILKSSTFGTGELIKDALDRGISNFTIAIGKSATNDGGMGCAKALGYAFLDSSNKPLEPVPENFEKIVSIDASNVHPDLADATFTVMCDVTNPLLGPSGASHIFAPQKGADSDTVDLLEKGMKHYSDILEKTFERNFSSILNNTTLVITGEGRVDSQSAYGKVISGVAVLCKEKCIPCIAVTGGIADDISNLYKMGILSVVPIVDKPMTLTDAIENSEKLLYDASIRLLSLIKLGNIL